MGDTEKGLYTNTQSKNLSCEGDISAVYGRLFNGVHMVNAVTGFNFSTKEYSRNGYKANGFMEDSFGAPSFSNGYPAGAKPQYAEGKARAASFYLKGGYSYDNRYLIDLNYRADGTSVFGTGVILESLGNPSLAWQEKH